MLHPAARAVGYDIATGFGMLKPLLPLREQQLRLTHHRKQDQVEPSLELAPDVGLERSLQELADLLGRQRAVA